MKSLKRLSIFVILFGVMFLFTGCSNKNVEGSLEDIMAKLYVGIPEEELPGFLENKPINSENVEGFLGSKDIKYKEALASETMMTSMAYSAMLIRTEEKANIEEVKEAITKSINDHQIYRKWICVGVEPEEVVVKNKGDLILVLIVQDENTRNKLSTNFDNL